MANALQSVQNPASQPVTSEQQRSLREALNSLTNWWPGETLPADLSSITLDQAIAAANAHLVPVTERQMLVGITMLIQHASAFNVQTDDKALEHSYRRECERMPGELFERGLRSVLAVWHDSFRLPTPSAIWDAVRSDYDRMLKELRQLEAARAAGSGQVHRISEAPKALRPLDDLMADVRRTLTTATPKGMRSGL